MQLDTAIQHFASQGWQVVYRTDSAVQMKKPKEWSKGGLILFVVLPLLATLFFLPAFGIALFGLVFLLADYLLRSDRTIYFTAEQTSAGIPKTKEPSQWRGPIIVGTILILGFLFLIIRDPSIVGTIVILGSLIWLISNAARNELKRR